MSCSSLILHVQYIFICLKILFSFSTIHTHSNSLSASCVHVSCLLHALVSLKPSPRPNPTSIPVCDTEAIPVTSLLNSWKPPRKRKESSMMMTEAHFEKHVYGRTKKHHMVPLESFDPSPAEFQNTASSSLDTFLEAMKGKGLGVSLLFDPTVRVWRNSPSSAGPSTAPPTPEDYNIVPKQVLQAEVASLKNHCLLVKQTYAVLRGKQESNETLISGSKCVVYV